MPKRALLVAFHFPPIKASSGLERTLSLARHLPAHGWEPLVLSASPKAYPAVSDERLHQIPSGTIVERCFARDASRHFAVAGRYPAWFTLPDRWQTWILGAIPAGLAMIRRHRPDLIWSTYPISSAHFIGYALHRLSGLPWIADFRDPMVEFDKRRQTWAPAWPALRRLRLAAEQRAAKHGAGLTFCTEGARRICADRYPTLDHRNWRIVANGFDESTFAAAEGSAQAAAPVANSPLTLLHSGTIYPTPDRDPSHFLRALRRVLDRRPPCARRLRVVLRASGVEDHYRQLIGQLNLADCVEFPPAIPYQSALEEMLHADAVLLFQGYTSNPAIPAKLYEYFRARRPILALADADGDTAGLIRREQVGTLAPLDDEDRIAAALTEFLADVESGRIAPMSDVRVAEFERANGARKFAALFDEIIAK